IDDAGDTGSAQFSMASPWAVNATEGNSGPKVYKGGELDGACSDLTSPILTLQSPASGPQLSFAAKDTLEFDPFGIFGFSEGSVGEVQIATGPSFSSWTRVPLTPNYPTFVDGTFTACDNIQDGRTYFSDNHPTYATYTA